MDIVQRHLRVFVLLILLLAHFPLPFLFAHFFIPLTALSALSFFFSAEWALFFNHGEL